MIQPTIIFRSIAKITLWVAATIILLGTIWFAANRLLDAPPDPRRAAYARSPADQIPDARNIAVGLLGLTAPSDADPMQFGVEVKAFAESNADGAQIQKMLQGPHSLQPTVQSDQIMCWTESDGRQWEGCLPLDQVPMVLKQNRVLLDRYYHLYRLDHYANNDALYNVTFFTVLKLSVAEMRLDIRQRDYEVAYRKWRNQLVFIRKILTGSDGYVGKSIGLVAVGMTMPVLEDLLLASPAIAKDHFQELADMLWPDGMDMFYPEGLVRAEFAFEDRFFQSPSGQGVHWNDDRLAWMAFHLGQKNRILNRLFEFFQEYESALHLPWKQMNTQLDHLGEKYARVSDWDFSIDPFGSMFVRDQSRMFLKYRALLEQMYIVSGRFRLATLVVRIINERIVDKDTPHFLATDPSLYDPFSNTPMQWDGQARKICFPDPKGLPPPCVRVPPR